MAQKAQCSTSENGNTKRVIRARYWHITVNNYTVEDMAQWTQLLLECEKYVWQCEVGENGNNHIQGHIGFKNPRGFEGLKKALPRAHIERVRNVKASEAYCQKAQTRAGETHIKGFKKIISREQMILDLEYKNVVWKDWQQDIINIIEGPVDKRKIYWYWEAEGNVGKSFIGKYLATKYDAIIATGKTNDIFNQVKTWVEENKDVIQLPPTVIDNPRSDFGHINYAAIEQLKNGFLYSGKYEGGKILGIGPHIFVFANDEPDMEQLSKDRFVIKKIGGT